MTSRIPSATEPFSDNKGARQVIPELEEFKRMFNPFYLIECD
jgi:hypothetical protein